jgi:glycosyltransferase involved in cell wall biosynthesis
MANKILYTTTSYPPAIGGAQAHTHQIAKRLSPHHSIQVVTLWNENRTDWLLGTTLRAPAKPLSYQFETIPVELITLTWAERARLLPFVLSYYALKPVAIAQIAGVLLPKIKPLAQKCSLIHNLRIGREPLSFASLQVARQLDIPFIFTPYHHPRWVGWNYREYLGLYRQADALIALTQVEKQILGQLGVNEERIFVTGMGPIVAAEAHPNRLLEQLRLGPDTPLILFLGQKYRYKGIEALTVAAKIVWRQWPEARFLFIGPRTGFSKKFFAGQKDARLIELGPVDLQYKTDALAACTLLCLPSSQESFGGVYTEAWSFGKPVIGADLPAVREVIDEGVNGYLTPVRPQIIADRICYLLRYPEVAKKLGQAGREKTLRHYSWERLAQKTEEIYTNVLQRH